MKKARTYSRERLHKIYERNYQSLIKAKSPKMIARYQAVEQRLEKMSQKISSVCGCRLGGKDCNDCTGWMTERVTVNSRIGYAAKHYKMSDVGVGIKCVVSILKEEV